MGFGLGNILGLAGDAAGLVATGGMDPEAWMNAVGQVDSMASGSGSSSDAAGMEQAFGQMAMSMLQNATDD